MTDAVPIGVSLRRTTGWAAALALGVVYSRALDEFFVLGTSLSLGQVVVVFAAGLLVLQGVTGGGVGDWRTGFMIVVPYSVLGLVSMLHASNAAASADELGDFLQNAVVFMAMLLAIDTKGRLRASIWSVVGAGSLVAAVNLYQLATRTFDQRYWGLAQAQVEVIVNGVEDFRIGGPGLGPNGLAHALIFCIPLAVERSCNDPSKRMRWVSAAATMLLVIATMYTYSRNGFITMIVIAMLIALYRGVGWVRIAQAGVVGTLLLVAIAPPSYVDRLGTLASLGSTENADRALATGRISEYAAGINMYVDHPFLGVGLNNYPSRYLEYSEVLGIDNRREERHPHSLYLQIASELGAVGLLWLIMVVALCLVGLHAARRRCAPGTGFCTVAGVEIAFIGFLWFSLFRHIALVRYFLIPIGLALAAAHVSMVTRDSSDPSTDGQASSLESSNG